jgi:hypothetical protein
MGEATGVISLTRMQIQDSDFSSLRWNFPRVEHLALTR